MSAYPDSALDPNYCRATTLSEVKETLKILFVREVKDKAHIHAIYSNEAGRREDTEASKPVMYIKTFAARRGHDGRPILPLLYVENK